MRRARTAISYLFVAAITVAIAALLILCVGSSIGEAFSSFFRGIFGTSYAISEVLVKATPLILCGLGVAVAFQSGFTNIGAEGQLYMGAIAITVVGTLFPNLPAIAMMPLSILAGFLLGGLWAFIPGFLKARFRISEVIVTIMFNYIAINIVGILVRTVLADPEYPYPMSPVLPEAASLSRLADPNRLHTGIFIALALAIVMYIVIYRMPIGYQMRAVGLNPRASACSGISVFKCILLSSLISGGLAGIAGVCEVAGLQHKLIEGISPSYGYIAVIIALLGKNNPFGVVLSALGIAALQVGSLAMQRSANVPTSISTIIMGLVVLLILARRVLFRFILKEKEA